MAVFNGCLYVSSGYGCVLALRERDLTAELTALMGAQAARTATPLARCLDATAAPAAAAAETADPATTAWATRPPPSTTF